MSLELKKKVKYWIHKNQVKYTRYSSNDVILAQRKISSEYNALNISIIFALWYPLKISFYIGIPNDIFSYCTLFLFTSTCVPVSICWTGNLLRFRALLFWWRISINKSVVNCESCWTHRHVDTFWEHFYFVWYIGTRRVTSYMHCHPLVLRAFICAILLIAPQQL